MMWHYYLAVPVSALAEVNQRRQLLGNPSSIEESFFRIPSERSGEFPELGDYIHSARFYLASFITGEQGQEALTAMASQSGLTAAFWVRSKNPHHPSTPDSEKGIVVASNWDAFPIGAAVSWSLVSEAIALL